jgi:hypothetical protein
VDNGPLTSCVFAEVAILFMAAMKVRDAPFRVENPHQKT